MTPEIKKTLDLALEKINKAREKVAALCDGKERWTMSVPVRPDYDHDVVISGALSVAEDAITHSMQTVQEPVAMESGKRLIVVDQSFTDLMYWLDRCEDKGHLENCPDLVEAWSAFQYENYTTPPAPAPVQKEN
jgi:hypothetical protein